MEESPDRMDSCRLNSNREGVRGADAGVFKLLQSSFFPDSKGMLRYSVYLSTMP